jgi:peptide/nickel transport system permease protein
MQALRENKLAYFSFWILILLYFLAIFADFISPYYYGNEKRELSYCPPTKIHFIDSKGKFHLIPFVYRYKYHYNQYRQKIFIADKSEIYPIELFVRGDSYRFLGIFKTNIHLFGVNPVREQSSLTTRIDDDFKPLSASNGNNHLFSNGVNSPARIYLFGADSRGRDLFSRILYGARISLSIGIIGVAITFLIGLIIGGISGYFGGKVDNFIMRGCEMIMMIPSFYLLLALRASFPPELGTTKIYFLLIIILSFIGWASLARVIRGMVLSIKEKEYVMAAKAIGCSHLRIIVRHILPNTFSYAIVATTLAIPGYILGESALSLLGLGIQDPVPSWGNLLSDAMSIYQIKLHPWILIPGFFIFITIMAFNLLGDGLRDVFDPRRKS